MDYQGAYAALQGELEAAQQRNRELQAANELLTGQLLNKTAAHAAGMVSQAEYERMFVHLKGETEAAQQRNVDLTSWIKAANQFAWAHEKGCPHYADAGSKCTCGLDQFLSRPRPFVESYKQQVADLQQELDAAKNHIAELQENLDVAQEGLDAANKRSHELFRNAAQHFKAKEAAEHKLATYRDLCERSYRYLGYWFSSLKLKELKLYTDLHVALQPDVAHEDTEVFAQTDQPPTKSDKSDIAALVDAGYTLHDIASARMLSWVDEPDVAPFVQDFKFRRRIYGLGHELIATALAQIEQPPRISVPANLGALAESVRGANSIDDAVNVLWGYIGHHSSDLYKQIGAANQRNKELEQWHKEALDEADKWRRSAVAHLGRAEAAERKLADVREQVQFVKNWFLQLENGLPESDPLTAMRRKYHAPVQIEQPQRTPAQPTRDEMMRTLMSIIVNCGDKANIVDPQAAAHEILEAFELRPRPTQIEQSQDGGKR